MGQGIVMAPIAMVRVYVWCFSCKHPLYAKSAGQRAPIHFSPIVLCFSMDGGVFFFRVLRRGQKSGESQASVSPRQAANGPMQPLGIFSLGTGSERRGWQKCPLLSQAHFPEAPRQPRLKNQAQNGWLTMWVTGSQIVSTMSQRVCLLTCCRLHTNRAPRKCVGFDSWMSLHVQPKGQGESEV